MSESLKLIFEILVVIEIVAMEVSFSVWAMRKKSNVLAIIISDILLTVVIVFFIIFFFSKTSGYRSGKNLFFGIVYIIPPLLFSKMRIKDTIIIIMLGFLYGLLVYALSLRLAYFFDMNYLGIIVFVIQTLIHMVIWIIFFSVKKKYRNVILPVLSEKIKTRALILALISFLLVISFNANLTTSTNYFQKLLAVVLLSASVVFSLIMIIELWLESAQTERLSNEVKVDKLTGLKNRISFKEDVNMLIDKKIQFSIIYIDLDKFKKINDTYGHFVGDKYLIAFSELINKYETAFQKVYRLSGDEFCFITEDKEQTIELLLQIKKIDKILDNIKFLGFSYGIADYPTNGDDVNLLLQHSDMEMYHMKNKRNSKY